MKKGMNPDDTKTSLTFAEKITVAWAYHVKGVDQHTLAAIYGVNSGRISEACRTIEMALKDEKNTRA